MRAIVRRADRLVVMARHAAGLLETVYDVAPEAHRGHSARRTGPGLVSHAAAQRKLGLKDGPLMLTFGLLSPGKGIETALQALPAIVAEQPDLNYLIVGATRSDADPQGGRALSPVAARSGAVAGPRGPTRRSSTVS